MKRRTVTISRWMLAACGLLIAVTSSQAQTNVLINAFNTADEVTDTANGGANAWQNWFGTAYNQVLWDSSDASNNPSSGSLHVQAFYPDAGIGGCCGPQFVAMNGYNGMTPPLAGNGGPPTSALATNVQFDIRWDPASDYDTNNLVWPELEVGTRGINFNQYDFGTLSGALAIPITQTNWVHVSMPIGVSANWATIPNIFFKFYGPTYNGFFNFFVDNIVFNTAPVAVVPPILSLQKPSTALRFFASPTQYSRSQLVAVDTNQSWVGGTFPVSYSFTISAYDNNPVLNEFHLFLIPLNSDQGGVINQYTDYSTASNSVRLQIVGMGNGSNPVVANIAWKTNVINSNPTVTELQITNPTAIGTWTLTFTSASAGTLTAPGASAVPFTITDPTVSADFGNPMAVFFGLQPNQTGATIGQHADFTHFQTVHVASPGVPINTDFTTGVLDTNTWSTTATADVNAMVMVPSGSAWWVNWTFPDYNSVLATSPTASGSVPWKTPFYYTGYNSNSPIYQYNASGGRVWALIPTAALATSTGISNGVPASTAYFRLMFPGPAQ